jgi:Ca2+-transporting ATPase
VLCSDAELKRESDGSYGILGDPTEGALVVAAAKAGIDDFSLRSAYPRQGEIPFSSERQGMAVWVSDPGGQLQAPLGPLAKDSQVLLVSKGLQRWCWPAVTAGWRPLGGSLGEEQRSWWLDQARQLAASGLRVLAFACAPHHPGPEQAADQLMLLGLMAQLDPARPEVAVSVATCRSAGIRPVMITGDHPLTARAIGASIGLTAADSEVVLGRDLEAYTDKDLQAVVDRCSLYARVPPSRSCGSSKRCRPMARWWR